MIVTIRLSIQPLLSSQKTAVAVFNVARGATAAKLQTHGVCLCGEASLDIIIVLSIYQHAKKY